jgi:hypothetical protein
VILDTGVLYAAWRRATVARGIVKSCGSPVLPDHAAAS